MAKKFVVIGHVDTGKSCLCGHLLYKCGHVTEHEMDKIRLKAKQDKMERWIWSRVLDIYEEEMSRGKTHEYTTMNFSYNNTPFELIDTPGHGTFIREMIQGISQGAQIAVLLVSMADNEFDSSFERGMLKEHLILARSLNIKHLIILANKMDLINWDKQVYEERLAKIRKFLNRIKWYNTYEVPISAFLGIGLVNLEGMPEWYKGVSFIDTLSSIEIQEESTIMIETQESNRVIVNLKILETKGTIITQGFKCIAHVGENETGVEIIKMKNKKFLRQGDSTTCVIQFSNPVHVHINKRIVFRINDFTIGFGQIIKI